MSRAPRAASTQSSHHRPAPYRRSANSHTSSPSGQRAPASAWSESDDNKLLDARHQGLAWQAIATEYFPSKTANACRKRYERLQERLKVEQWDGGIKVVDVAKAYIEVREEMWKILASKVEGGNWKVVERKCMEKGLKPLLSAGRNAKGRSKSDTSGGGNDSDRDDPNNDSGIAFVDTDPPDENGTSGPMPPMQGPPAPSSSPPPPPPPSQHHIPSSSDHKTSSKSSNRPYHHAPPPTPMPQSATASSQPSFQHSFEMPSIASILQSVSVRSF